MDLDYTIAEYFVEAISISPHFELTFDSVNVLRDLIGKEISLHIAEYLNQKSAYDFLYIFKRFPDIFDIKSSSVSLKESFFSLNCLTKSLFISRQFNFNDNYVQSCTILYISNLLITHGPQQYITLFNTFMNDHTQMYNRNYVHFTVMDVYSFFLTHSNLFVVDNYFVFLKRRGVTQPFSYFSNQIEKETFRIFELSVYFLLTCFKSLHYLELKQCLSYVQESTKSILEQNTLVRQREIFENLPISTMDAFGFLSLKIKELIINLPDVTKTILLIVCIIAFKKEIHIVDLVIEFSKRMPSSANFFLSLTLSEKLKFLEKYPSYFCFSDSGHIKLFPTFILPSVSFPQSSHCENTCHLQTVEQNSMKTDKTQDCNTTKDILMPNSAVSNLCNNNSKNKFTNYVEQIRKADSLAMPKYLLSVSGLSKGVSKRIKESFLYLSKYFYPLNEKYAVQTLLHALDDVRKSFCALSEPDKFNLVTVCTNFVKCLSKECVESTTNAVNYLVTEKEANLLFITYMLITNGKVNFLRFIETMESHNIDNTLVKSAVSDQFKYFKTLTGYVNLLSDGHVILSPSFFPIKSLVESYFDLLCDPKFVSQKMPSQVEMSSMPETNTCKTVSSCAKVVPLECKSFSPSTLEVSFANTSVELPENICAYLNHCAILLRKYYKFAATIHILKATIFSLPEVYNHFENLSICDQFTFVKNCFIFLNEEIVHRATIITKTEREILFTTYLICSGTVHYRKITKELSLCGCNRLSLLKDGLQFRHFRTTFRYFSINSDGFVRLSSTFDHIDGVVNAAINCKSKHENMSESSIDQSRNLHKIEPKLPLLKNVMTKDFCTQTFSKDFSVSLQNAKNAETSLEIEMLDANRKADLRDVVFHLLSTYKKININKLCYKLDSCNLKGICDMLSSYTLPERINFFRNLSPDFKVSKDDFVSLNEDLPNTDINHSESFEKSNSASVKSSSVQISRSESLLTFSGDSLGRNQIGDGKNRSSNNAISYETHKITNEVHSHKSLNEVSDNNSHPQTSVSAENASETLSLHSVSNETECRSLKHLNRDDEITNSPPESKDSSFEKTNSFPLSVPENICHSKKPCQTFENSTSASLSKSNSSLLENTPAETEVVDSSLNDDNIPLQSNDYNQTLSKTFDPNSNSSNTSACGTVLFTDSENIPFFEEIDEDIQIIGMSSALRDRIKNNDSSHQAYISDLIDEILESDKTRSSSSKPSNSRNVLTSDKNHNADLNASATNTKKNEHQYVYTWSKVSDANKDSSSNKKKNQQQNLPECTMISEIIPQQSSIPGEKGCDNVPEAVISKNLEPLSTANKGSFPEVLTAAEEVIENRAVNFFTIRLNNYKRYDESISVDFLKQQMVLASSEVHSFMYKYYRDDFLPFFQKHKKVFYVSPQTRCVYLLRKL